MGVGSHYGSLQTTVAVRSRICDSDGRVASRRSDGERSGHMHSWNRITYERAQIKPGKFAADRSEKRKALGGSARGLGRGKCPILGGGWQRRAQKSFTGG